MDVFAEIGSFRGARAFLAEYPTRDREGWRDGDYMRFCESPFY
jgi:hypothetical protein